MDAALKEKWVEALRSGKFKQGRGRLCNDGKYCCLGVLATIEGMEIGGEGNFDHLLEGGQIVGYEPIVRVLAGFSFRHLVALNDGGGGLGPHSFNEIANYIEANIPGESA